MANALKISEAASLALHAIIILAQNKDKLISVKQIATHLDVSSNHLSKVMQRLTKAEFIESIKGYNGGFKLLGNPEEINLLMIYELFDGKLKTDSCLLSQKKCLGECILGDLVASINKQAREKFENTKISDFIKNEN